MELGIIIATCVFGFVMGILILVGKGDFMIKILRKPGAEKYNLGRLRLINALAMLVAIPYIIAIHLVARTPDAQNLIWVLTGILLVVVVILQILERTWAKRK